jgi:hypothetical protein
MTPGTADRSHYFQDPQSRNKIPRSGNSKQNVSQYQQNQYRWQAPDTHRKSAQTKLPAGSLDDGNFLKLAFYALR